MNSMETFIGLGGISLKGQLTPRQKEEERIINCGGKEQGTKGEISYCKIIEFPFVNSCIYRGGFAQIRDESNPGNSKLVVKCNYHPD